MRLSSAACNWNLGCELVSCLLEISGGPPQLMKSGNITRPRQVYQVFLYFSGYQ